MASVAEQNAAFDAVKVEIMKMIPPSFQAFATPYVTTDKILAIVRAALHAAEIVRKK